MFELESRIVCYQFFKVSKFDSDSIDLLFIIKILRIPHSLDNPNAVRQWRQTLSPRVVTVWHFTFQIFVIGRLSTCSKCEMRNVTWWWNGGTKVISNVLPDSVFRKATKIDLVWPADTSRCTVLPPAWWQLRIFYFKWTDDIEIWRKKNTRKSYVH